MKVKLDDQEEFDNNIWKDFENLFAENTNEPLDLAILTDFYYRYLIAKIGYFAKNRLYVKFMEYLDSKVKDDVEALEIFVNELKRFGHHYLRIKNFEADESELRLAFKRFQMLDVDTALPLLMVLYDNYDNEEKQNKTSLSDFISMLQAIESFIIRRSIKRMRTRGYGLDFAQAIEYTSSFNSFITFLAKKGWPTDQHIIDALTDFPVYHHERKKAFLILSEIERSSGHKEQVQPTNLTIEHVMPQSLTIAWRDALGPEAEAIHSRLVHTIGNLTLTAYNPNLGNDSFDIKKEIYTDSKLSINSYFASYETWGESEIIERSKKIIDQFIKLWPRPKEIGQVGVDESEFGQQLSFDF
jgi:hypothetical protein